MNRIRLFLSCKLSFVSIFMSQVIAFAKEEAQATAPAILSPQAMFATEINTAKNLMDLIAEFFVKYSFQALGGLIILILGIVIAKFVSKFLNGFLAKHNVDVTVSKFACSIVKIIIIMLSGLIALGKFGITIAPFIAGISVIGFGATFALQGPLSNYASGITLIFTKPFKVGDIIEVSGAVGEVQDITLARTELKTIGGTLVVIPNKQIVGEIIHNYSEFKKLDITVGVGYESNTDKAISIVQDIVTKDSRAAQSPTPIVGISEFADSSINIHARLRCKQADYWALLFSINKKINEQFKTVGIVIPFPQRDVHLYEEK